jgi:hypothetical protein
MRDVLPDVGMWVALRSLCVASALEAVLEVTSTFREGWGRGLSLHRPCLLRVLALLVHEPDPPLHAAPTRHIRQVPVKMAMCLIGSTAKEMDPLPSGALEFRPDLEDP